MRPANTELERQILDAAMELLVEKDPSEIGMRSLAEKCGISATSIYHYYKDKNELFIRISVTCLEELKDRIEENVSQSDDLKTKLRLALESYRDWCFENPRRALLVFSRLEEDISEEQLESYYVCNRLGEVLVHECVKGNPAAERNARLDTGIIICGMWGCIEGIITRRTEPEFWDKGRLFTDRFIDFVLENYFGRIR